ncbi:MAG: acyl-CoA reductase [Candidatus Hydrothermia bacterium]
MRRDALSLLDKYAEFLLTFKEYYEKGKVKSDIVYQKNLLLSSLNQYIECVDFFKSYPDNLNGPEKVFVILPGNVPVVIFQIFPVFLLSNVKKVFIKQPSVEKSFYNEFVNMAKNFLGKFIEIHTRYMTHEETFNEAKKYDFIVGYGGENLGALFKTLGKPSRFFGPKLSIGILWKEPSLEVLKKIAFDNLAFDTRGCLSLRYLFTPKKIDEELISRAFNEVSLDLVPQSNFDYSFTEYEVLKASLEAEKVVRGESFFLLYSRKLLRISAPRVLNIVVVDGTEGLQEMLNELKEIIQGVATDNLEVNVVSVSYYCNFGELQFPPCNWFFERGVTLENFWEVSNV